MKVDTQEIERLALEAEQAAANARAFAAQIHTAIGEKQLHIIALGNLETQAFRLTRICDSLSKLFSATIVTEKK